MDALEKANRLKDMLSQIASAGIESVAKPPREETTFGLESTGPVIDHGANAESGLRKLAQNRPQDLTGPEVFALEAIVMPQNRPVVFVRDNSYDDVPDPWSKLNPASVKSSISALFSKIGRIELPLNPLIPYGGTGFVVGDGLLMTNRHVAQLFSSGLGMRIKYQTGGSAIDFKRQIDTADDDRTAFLSVKGVEMIHPFWDMALLRVEGLPSSGALPLSVSSPEDLVDRDIIVVGYPARDFRSDLDVQDRIFGGKYNVKRLQPGTARPRAKIASFESVVNAMTHDASTLGGNSGSAVIDVQTGQLVALHFAGEYLKANYAVPMYELARDRRVAPLLNFTGSVASTNEWEPAWRSTEDEAPKPAAATASSGSAPAAPLQSPSAPTPAVSAPASGLVASWTIPLHVSVSLGQPVMAGQPAFAAASTGAVDVEAEEAVVVDQDYSDRPGYDPDFLETISVPLPTLSAAMEKDTAVVASDQRKNGNRFELAYYHYSVYMNKRRRTAWFSAANVDGDQRPKIGKRQGDRWYRDPRIDKSEQLGQEAFESGIDRGHLTRREDTAWGENVKGATAANNDTFHFTNCSLQASAFNRGKDRWQGLEQFLLEQHAKPDKRRMMVITGPLFSNSDPTYRNEKMDYSVGCPLKFWKVCVLIRADGTPSATGFILAQEEIQQLPGFEEAFDVGAAQIQISDLEKRTGLKFGDLTKHDHFAEGGAPGTIEAPIAGLTENIRPIRSNSQIVV
jgi:endonuclease G, mitochondrial